MAFSREQKSEIKNHIPTLSQNCSIFLHVFDAEMGNKDEDKAKFLVELVDSMEKDLQEVKDILDTQIP